MARLSQQDFFFIFFTFCSVYWADLAHGSNILVLSPITAPSHSNFVRPIVQTLARRGHTLAYWNGLKPNYDESSPNIRQLYSDELGLINSDHNMRFDDRNKPFQLFLAFYDRTIKYCTAIYQDPIFHQMMTTDEHFDLVLIEGVLNECVLPLIPVLKVPFIYLNSIAPTPWLLDALGSPQAFEIFPNPGFSFTDEMSLPQRILNTAAGLFLLLFRNWVLLPLVDQMALKMLNGSHLTSVTGVEERYLSMVLTNTHFSMNYQLPKTSDLVEVGGLHCLPTKPLPTDLENVVNGSGEAGFIIVSFGSILRGSNMPEETRKIFINTFKRLEQRVIWKWEGDSYHQHQQGNESRTNVSDVPDNVFLLPWLPQQDLLGHPKAKLFITHGGIFSNQEAVYHGVPLIAIPIFADQPINARKIQDDGYGIHLDWEQLTENSLYETIQRVLADSKFSERMKKVSELMRDQADHPLDRATYWIEYVIRHNGAPHLRTTSRKLSLIQKGLVDVTLIFLSLFIMLVSALVYVFYRITARALFGLPKINYVKKNN